MHTLSSLLQPMPLLIWLKQLGHASTRNPSPTCAYRIDSHPQASAYDHMDDIRQQRLAYTNICPFQNCIARSNFPCLGPGR